MVAPQTKSRVKQARHGTSLTIRTGLRAGAPALPADRHADSRNDLEAAGKVVGPANSRADEERARPFGLSGPRDGFAARPDRLEHQIERTAEPDHACAEVVAERIRLLSSLIASGGGERRSGVPVRDQLSRENRADWHGDLNTRR